MALRVYAMSPPLLNAGTTAMAARNNYNVLIQTRYTVGARRERDDLAVPPPPTRILQFGETTNTVFSKPSATKNTVPLNLSNSASAYENTVEMLDRNREIVSSGSSRLPVSPDAAEYQYFTWSDCLSDLHNPVVATIPFGNTGCQTFKLGTHNLTCLQKRGGAWYE
ncbi:uncharacterized protein LOC142986536 [Anticarsia gemmatalis]|uniref:uncharacterized protein LOC142986536 n=1 Tax=Anticarsia gemmatalis TaxID=129554 RepID=UPI003F757238